MALAPYITKTHPCEVHYMSGCQGEMVVAAVNVTVRAADGSMVLDQTMTTLPNGFIELWLPRDQEYRLTVGSGDKKAEGTIGTFADSNTCVTTYQLM